LAKILLANPAVSCRRRPRDRHRRARDRAVRSADSRGGEVVHNRFSVALRGLEAISRHELDEVPDGATVIFSAHGVSLAVCRTRRGRRGLRVFDATCPLVDEGAHGGPAHGAMAAT
jgi:4-hydroxy-3-methylbut-2-enyl diphosphate reductase